MYDYYLKLVFVISFSVLISYYNFANYQYLVTVKPTDDYAPLAVIFV